MTEFSALLKSAAGTPPRPLDMVDIRLRAARLRRVRRARLWLIGAIGLAGVGVPGVQLFAPAGQGTGVESIAPPGLPSHVEEDGDDSGSEPVAAEGDDPVGQPADLGTPEAQPVVPTTSAETGPDGPATTAAPAGSSCSIRAVEVAPGGSARCQFTATERGGWRHDSGLSGVPVGYPGETARVTVVRGGRSTVYSGTPQTGDPSCGDGVIEPGDEVIVELFRRQNDEIDDVVGAGAGWSCTESEGEET